MWHHQKSIRKMVSRFQWKVLAMYWDVVPEKEKSPHNPIMYSSSAHTIRGLYSPIEVVIISNHPKCSELVHITNNKHLTYVQLDKQQLRRWNNPV